MRKITLLFTIIGLCLAAGLAISQATDGNVTGLVTDRTDAVVPGAAIELYNLNTGVTRTAETGPGGVYRFHNVPVGKYRLTARVEGFAPAVLDNIEVTLNRANTANVRLELGIVSTQVEVAVAPAQIDTTTATIGMAFSDREAVYNPLGSLGLGSLNLSLLGGGVASPGGLGVGEGPSVGGQRPRQNNFMIEGVDNNRKDVTASNLRVPIEAVAEFSMLQNQFSAEFGHSTGGQFNTVLRGGANRLHGAFYEYFQNRRLNAMDQADARLGKTENARYDQNLFGGSLGGPIVKNRLFYYALLEYNPLGLAGSPLAATMTPTAEGYRLLETIPTLSRANLDVLKQYAAPAPSATGSTRVAGVAIPIGILPITFPSYFNTWNWLGSADYNLSGRDQLRFRYLETRSSGIDTSTSPNLPAFASHRAIRQRLFALSHFHTFTPALLNELRLNHNYYADVIPAGDFRFPGLDAFPNITIERDLNLQLGPFPSSPQIRSQGTYQLVNNVTWIRGAHAVKAGIDARRYIAPKLFTQRLRGDYNYSTLERYLLDLQPDLAAQRNTGYRPYWGNAWNFYWFVQDEMRLRRNLTVTTAASPPVTASRPSTPSPAFPDSSNSASLGPKPPISPPAPASPGLRASAARPSSASAPACPTTTTSTTSAASPDLRSMSPPSSSPGVTHPISSRTAPFRPPLPPPASLPKCGVP